MTFEHIPPELKALNQWLIWREELTVEGKPTKVPYSATTGRLASVTNPADWSSWLTANAALAASGYNGLGFVFTRNDPFCGIDLDYTTDPGILAMQNQVYATFAGRTYAELSQSGQGLHFIGIGAVPTGKRRGKIEVYSSERFFAMTGNVHGPYVSPAPMQSEVDWLYAQLGGNNTGVSISFEGAAQTADDLTIYNRALSAVNGDKFLALWQGNWQDLGYPSQSEADFALIDILGFYTQNVDQVRRLFRMSALGQREKAQSDKPRVHGLSYVDYQIRRSFDNQPPPIDTEAVRAAIEAQFANELMPPVDEVPAPSAVPEPPRGANPYLRPVPGLLGQIAYYIYKASPRPVPEIALAGAIGLMAGICGRAWNVSGTGLNQYIMLLADTGTGKDALHIGVNRLMERVTSVQPGGGGCPAAKEFIGPGDIASGQALVKHLSKQSASFVTIQGEFDLTLKGFVSRHANAAMLKLKQIVLKAYGQSGRGQLMPGTIYSDTDKNTQAIASPAFSIVGEGTPERFYNLLDEALVADGLLPRFTIIHYDGSRVPLHKAHRDIEPPSDLVAQLASLCGQSLMLNQANNVIDVTVDHEAQAVLDAYDTQIDGVMNGARGDVFKQIWNRAHLKALKLSALIAVGVNSTAPVVTFDMAQYAIDIVNYDTVRLVNKFEAGDVGESEGKQVSDVRRVIRRYLQMIPSADNAAKYGATEAMMQDKIIPKRYLQQRVSSMASFRGDRIGATNALNRQITALIEAGILREVGPMQKAKYGGTEAKLYVVAEPRWLGEGASLGPDY